MAKIHTIKNDRIEFPIFASARVFTLFQAKHKLSVFEFIQAHPHDMEGYADALYFAYKSACKLEEKQEKYSSEDFLDLLDMNELVSSVATMLGVDLGSSAPADKKK